MKSLKQYIHEARDQKKAIGHFNISNIETLWAIVHAGQKVSSEVGEQIPIIIGTSEGERKALGDRQAVALVHSIREEYNYPLFINADHCHTVEAFTQAIDAGFDMAIIDNADKNLEENISITKEAVTYARNKDNDILVESELGYIGQSSVLLDDLPEGAHVEGVSLTSPEDAKRLIDETGADLLAPAVGNIHGMLKHAPNPRLDIEIIRRISEAVPSPLVLHGGSGISRDDFRDAIEAGIAIVHINTELRLISRQHLEKILDENPDEVSPYKLMAGAKEAMQGLVEDKVRLFWGVAN